MASQENKQPILMTYVALVSLCNDVDATPAPSYDAALAMLRERADTWDWEIDPKHPLDRSTASLEQLSKLYAHGEDEEISWVNIVELTAPYMAAPQAAQKLTHLEQRQPEQRCTLKDLTALNAIKNRIRNTTKLLDATTKVFPRNTIEATQLMHAVSILLSELRVHGLLPDDVNISDS